MWNACFKSHMRRCYDAWLSEPSLHEFTKGGNMKAPSRSLVCEWVKSSWDAVSTEMVLGSFMSCAITTSTTGSDDNKIHCFKPGQPCDYNVQLRSDSSTSSRVAIVFSRGNGRKNKVPLHALRELYVGTLWVYVPSRTTVWYALAFCTN